MATIVQNSFILAQNSTHVVQKSDMSNSLVYQTLGNIVIDLRTQMKFQKEGAGSYMWRVEIVYQESLVKEASGVQWRHY